MISIFIMYSNDRNPQLMQTVEFLRKMPEYRSCQKTLIVDGDVTTSIPEGWRSVCVPRFKNKFCWARMWDAGVGSALYDKVLYLDSDRLLPSDYISLVNENLVDDVFVFSSYHFMLTREVSSEVCRKFMIDAKETGVFMRDEFIGLLNFDPRYKDVLNGSGKNVMSGNTAFTKKTFYKLGGVDPWYCGHGAFADTDFHMTAYRGGCRFIDLKSPELHCYHPKRKEDGSEMTSNELKLKGLDNFIYYCVKWKIPLEHAEDMACLIDVDLPKQYVAKIAELISKESWTSD